LQWADNPAILLHFSRSHFIVRVSRLTGQTSRTTFTVASISHCHFGFKSQIYGWHGFVWRCDLWKDWRHYCNMEYKHFLSSKKGLNTKWMWRK
jgi:hypothetical protein